MSRLKYLLAQGADVDARDGTGVPALYRAAFRGDHANVCLMLDVGANVNSRHDTLGPPVLAAALKSHGKVVEILLKHKADVSVSTWGLGSALHCACFNGDIGIIESLMRHGDSLERFEPVHLNALATMASSSAMPSRVYKLLDREAWLSERGVRCSPLFLAAERHHFDLLQVIGARYSCNYLSTPTWDLSGNNPPVPQVESDGISSTWSSLGFPLMARSPPQNTLLMWGAACLDLPLIEHLIEAGASTATQNVDEHCILRYAASPFEYAIFKDVRRCVQRLVDGGATLPINDFECLVAADHAALDVRTSHRWGIDIHTVCVSAFLDTISSAEDKREASRVALPEAVCHPLCPEDSIRLLCKHAADPNQDPPFQQAAGLCFNRALNFGLRHSATQPVIAMLLEYGAGAETSAIGSSLCYVERTTGYRWSARTTLDNARAMCSSPLSVAIDMGASYEVVETLLRYGADPHNQELRSGSYPGMTPYSIAHLRGRLDLMSLFDSSTPSAPNARVDHTHVSRSQLSEPSPGVNLTHASRFWLLGIAAIPVPSFLRGGGQF
jgi:ankyrin repeat protein